MRIHQSLLTYLVLYLALSLVLKFFGFITLSGSEIISYALIFYGITDVFLTLGKNRKFSLFFGTVCFLTGILLYVLNNFLIFWDPTILLPSVFIIPGIAFLMLRFDNPLNKKHFVIGIVLILAGLIAMVVNKQFSLSTFYQSMINVTSLYWQVVLVIVGILIFIIFEERK